MERKWCPECGYTKPLSDFFRDRRATAGVTSYCKPCMTRRNAESRARRAAGEVVIDRRPARRPAAAPRTERRCPACEETKPLEAFVRNRRGTDGYGAYCRPCHNRIVAENRRRHGGSRTYHLFRRYGLTSEQVAAMVEAQGGGCAICRVRPAEHVDHDHATGAVRGVLCFTCNVGLGNFRDEPERLLLAYDYLTAPDAATVATARARVLRLTRRAS